MKLVQISASWRNSCQAFSRNNRLPFAVGQVGHSFRNEISTGNGLIRTREFQMAEIEHFFDPLDVDFEDFQLEMKNLVIPVWTENAQLNGQTLSAIPISDINMARGPRTTSELFTMIRLNFEAFSNFLEFFRFFMA